MLCLLQSGEALVELQNVDGMVLILPLSRLCRGACCAMKVNGRTQILQRCMSLCILLHQFLQRLLLSRLELDSFLLHRRPRSMYLVRIRVAVKQWNADTHSHHVFA